MSNANFLHIPNDNYWKIAAYQSLMLITLDQAVLANVIAADPVYVVWGQNAQSLLPRPASWRRQI